MKNDNKLCLRNVKAERLLLMLVLCIAFGVTLYCQLPLLMNDYAINGDVREKFYYLHYSDTELFKDDIIADFFMKRNSIIINTLYQFTSLFYDPIQFTKIVPFILCVISTFYMFKLGASIGNTMVGLLSGFMFVCVAWTRGSVEWFGTSDAGDFPVPLCIMFLYYMLQKRFIVTMCILCLQAFIYPPTLMICLPVYIITVYKNKARDRHIERKHIFIVGCVLLSTVAAFLLTFGPFVMQISGQTEMRTMPEFYPGGVRDVYYSSVYRNVIDPEIGLNIDYPLTCLIIIACILLLVLKKEWVQLPSLLWIFIGVSVILFSLASIGGSKLYWPSRYLGRYPLPLFLIILNAVNIERMLKKISSPKAKSVVFMGVMVGISILFFPALRSYYRVAPYPKLYNFIATLPKDALIAGHPSLMDYIPLFAKRKVLVSSEILEPEFRSHYGVMKERVYNFFTAYYATSTREIYDFCERYGVTHLIIDTSQFRREYLMQGDFYFKPFNEYIKKLVHKAFEQHPLMQYMPHEIVTSFALIRIPEGKYLYQQKDIFVVAVADIFPAADGIKN